MVMEQHILRLIKLFIFRYDNHDINIPIFWEYIFQFSDCDIHIFDCDRGPECIQRDYSSHIKNCNSPGHHMSCLLHRYSDPTGIHKCVSYNDRFCFKSYGLGHYKLATSPTSEIDFDKIVPLRKWKNNAEDSSRMIWINNDLINYFNSV